MEAVPGFPFEIGASDGYGDQARAIAERVDRARAWLSPILGFEPSFRLIVSSEEDWPGVSEFPVYGMPHTAGAERLVVGTEPAGFFTDVAGTFWPHLGDVTRARMRAAYGDPLDLGPFVDLIAVHELGHLYHEQVPFYFPAFWLNELFANLVLAGFVIDNEPDTVELVDAFAAAAVEAPPSTMPVRDLADMEASLQAGPGNYVWFEMVLIAGALALWRDAGSDALVAMHERFRRPMTAEEIAAELDAIHPSAGRIARHWPS